MARWRKVKTNKTTTKKNQDNQTQIDKTDNIPTFFVRFKSFMIDLFMLYVPIVYALAYLVFNGASEFRNSSDAGALSMFLYGVLCVAFWSLKGQTPGKKAYDLKLIDNKTGKNLSIIKAIFRYLAFLLSATTFVGVLLAQFRADKKALHDLITDSSVVYEKQ